MAECTIADGVVYRISVLIASAATTGPPGARDVGDDAPQLHALAYLSLRLHAYGFAIGSIFFGLALGLLGFLVQRSRYLPKVIGVLLVLAGMGYLINSVAQILDSDLAGSLVPWVLLPAFLGESGLALWLVIKGIDAPAWDEAAQRG